MSNGRTCSVRVARETDIRAQVSAASPFELVKDFASVSLVFQLPLTTPLSVLRRMIAQRPGRAQDADDGLWFWRFAERRNGTYRPSLPVEMREDRTIATLIHRGTSPPVVDLFLEEGMASPLRPLYHPDTSMLLFVKSYEVSGGQPQLRYKGYWWAHSGTPLRRQLSGLREVAGLDVGSVEVYEEVKFSPCMVDQVDMAKSPYEALLQTGDILVLSVQDLSPNVQQFFSTAAATRLLQGQQQQQQRQREHQGQPQQGRQQGGQQQQRQPQQEQQGQQQAEQQPGTQQQQGRAQQAPEQEQQRTEPRQQQQQRRQRQQQQRQHHTVQQQGMHGLPSVQRVSQLLRQAAEEADVAAGEMAQLRQRLQGQEAAMQQLHQQLQAREAELQQARDAERQMQEQLQAREAEVQQARDVEQRVQQLQQLVLQGDVTACRALSAAELETLHTQLEDSTARVRRLLIERRVEEARAEVQAEATECAICNAAPKDTRLNCGHLLCRGCSLRVSTCPVCRQPVMSRERAFL